MTRAYKKKIIDKLTDAQLSKFFTKHKNVIVETLLMNPYLYDLLTNNLVDEHIGNIKDLEIQEIELKHKSKTPSSLRDMTETERIDFYKSNPEGYRKASVNDGLDTRTYRG